MDPWLTQRIDWSVERAISQNGRRKTAAQIAGEVGVSEGLVSQWRKGTSLIQTPDLVALAKACGVDPGWLLAGADSDAQPPEWAHLMPPVTAPAAPAPKPVAPKRQRGAG